MRSSFTDPYRAILAYHEAGHVVQALHRFWDVKKVSLSERGGQTQVVPPRWLDHELRRDYKASYPLWQVAGWYGKTMIYRMKLKDALTENPELSGFVRVMLSGIAGARLIIPELRRSRLLGELRSDSPQERELAYHGASDDIKAVLRLIKKKDPDEESGIPFYDDLDEIVEEIIEEWRLYPEVILERIALKLYKRGFLFRWQINAQYYSTWYRFL